MNYLFDSWFAVIHQMQPTANIFSDAGPDVRWVGDEAGQAGTTNWNMMNKSLVTIGGGFEQYVYIICKITTPYSKKVVEKILRV